MRFLLTVSLVLAASAGLVASAGAAVIEVSISGMAFAPADVAARVGDTIEWDNYDFVAHTASALDKSFDVVVPAHGKARTVVGRVGRSTTFVVSTRS